MLGEIGGLFNAAVRSKTQELQNSLNENKSNQEVRNKIRTLLLNNLSEVDSEKFDQDKYIEGLRKGELASIETGRVRDAAELDKQRAQLGIRGEALNQNEGYQTRLLDTQTRNDLEKMGGKANILRGFLDQQIGYDKWSKGASDYDQLQRVLEYAGSENAANREMREKERKAGLVSGLIGNLLMGASAFFG